MRAYCASHGGHMVLPACTIPQAAAAPRAAVGKDACRRLSGHTHEAWAWALHRLCRCGLRTLRWFALYFCTERQTYYMPAKAMWKE